MEKDFQKNSDKIFNALQSGKITQKQAEILQRKLNDRQITNDQVFRERTEKVNQALASGEITDTQARSLTKRLEADYTPVVRDDTHPDVDFSTRALYKNFGGDGEAAFNFLQERHPQLEWRKDNEGNVLVKGRDEPTWSRLDPSGFDPADVTDVAWDIPAGIAEGAAAAGAGLLGSALGPAGALGAAGLAGSATATGLEGVRQGIGNLIGTSEGVNSGNLIGSALGGAASPLLLGTGAAGKQVARQALRSGLSDQAVTQAQRGLLSRIIGGTAGKLGQAMSGIDEEILQYARQNLSEIRRAEASGTGGAEIYGALRDKIETNLEQKLFEAGEKIGSTQGAEDILVNVGEAEKPLTDLLTKYQERAARDIAGGATEEAASVQKAAQLEGILAPYLKGDRVLKGGYELKDYLDDLNDITGIARNTDPNVQKTLKKDLMNAARRSASNVDSQAARSAGGQAYKEAKKEYSELLSVKNDVVNKFFKDDMATERSLNNLLSKKGKSKKLAINKAMEKLEVDVDDTARQSIANTLFINPNMDPISSGGTTSTSRSVPLGGVGGMLGYLGGSRLEGHGTGMGLSALGQFLGSKVGSPYAMRRYMETDEALSNFLQGINRQGTGYPMIQSGFNALRNIQQNRDY